jgi:hypothetical protein
MDEAIAGRIMIGEEKNMDGRSEGGRKEENDDTHRRINEPNRALPRC